MTDEIKKEKGGFLGVDGGLGRVIKGTYNHF